jgi:AcrR family transcriptional regulator
MKLTLLQIREAHSRAVHGESVRAIARSLSVTEGALRHHFRKGTSPAEIRRIAWDLFNAEQAARLLGLDLDQARRLAATK